MTSRLLEVEDLCVDFRTHNKTVRVVDEVAFEMGPGETLGLVGESGCGKTVAALALMGLVPSAASQVSGSVRMDGRECIGAPERELRKLRGREVSMVFQEPMTALNPVFTVGHQLTDVLRRASRIGHRAARSEGAALLERVGIARAAERMSDYPHELSGGMRQRILIAMALACRPRLLIADEPTTALDVTTQAQVLSELRELTAEFGTALLLISHDLGVVAELCSRVAVMYCGRIVEHAPTEVLLSQPRHRYTEALLNAIPRIRDQAVDRLPTIPGSVPEPGAWPDGCRFAPRCAHVDSACRLQVPEMRRIGEHRAACLHPADDRT